jgi:hypothetical protein
MGAKRERGATCPAPSTDPRDAIGEGADDACDPFRAAFARRFPNLARHLREERREIVRREDEDARPPRGWLYGSGH